MLLKMTLLLLTAIEQADNPADLVREFIDEFADRWTVFFCNSIIADIDEEFLNGHMFTKLVNVKSHHELSSLVGLVQRNHLKLIQTVPPTEQLEAVIAVIDKLKQAVPGWAVLIEKLKTHVKDHYKARYCTRIGINTLSNIILLAAQEPGKLLQLYPWLVSHPATRKRLKNSALYKRVNQEHFQALINAPAENTLSIKMAKVCNIFCEDIPELILHDILSPNIFEKNDDDSQSDQPQTRNRDMSNGQITSGDMMVVSTTAQLQRLSLATINSGTLTYFKLFSKINIITFFL